MTSDVLASRVDPGPFEWTSGAGGAADVRRVIDAAAIADGRSPLDEAALLALRHHGLDEATLFVAETADAEPAVVAFAVVHAGGRTQEPADMNLVVTPEYRRRRVGTTLGRAVVADFAGTPLVAWSHGNHPGASALARTLGFERVRDLWVMRRPLDDSLPPLRPIDGVDVRTFRPGEDDADWLRVNAEAFAHHPEQGRMTQADLDARMAEDWFDPAGFFLAVSASDGALLGFHWTKVHAADPPHGEVYVVGVSPVAQGSGLGKLLTLTGLHHLRAQGLGEVILYVESDNAAAVAVYEGLGFTHDPADTDVMYHRASGAPPSA
jgi:mycothiol synthase